MKLHESGAALAEGVGVTVSKMPDSNEAHCQASLNTAKDPDVMSCEQQLLELVSLNSVGHPVFVVFSLSFF